ncbi:hypothetical protein BKP37_08770 [Anaerobacillus alkalilacustris]|uniref:Uncharacterized protein n=1 Tax=Anaerobacillus alkalilacustris TaxID=393763 RepID=A0A1S2LQL9_9BACI|nr:hypothetical protein [Anaerobacillus alkalilacustris]OIJ14423.1 hypothetical protein BKP37_08770 [Anaerobacillus alkalilacustris]
MIIILFVLCGGIGNIVVFAEISNQIKISETPKLTNEKAIEKGSYQIKVGSSSENIYETVIFEVEKDMVVEKVNDVLRPTMEINKLSK